MSPHVTLITSTLVQTNCTISTTHLTSITLPTAVVTLQQHMAGLFNYEATPLLPPRKSWIQPSRTATSHRVKWNTARLVLFSFWTIYAISQSVLPINNTQISDTKLWAPVYMSIIPLSWFKHLNISINVSTPLHKCGLYHLLLDRNCCNATNAHLSHNAQKHLTSRCSDEGGDI